MHKKEATSFIFKISSVFGLIMGPLIRIQILRYIYIFTGSLCECGLPVLRHNLTCVHLKTEECMLLSYPNVDDKLIENGYHCFVAKYLCIHSPSSTLSWFLVPVRQGTVRTIYKETSSTFLNARTVLWNKKNNH